MIRAKNRKSLLLFSKRIVIFLAAVLIFAPAGGNARAQLFEDFDDVTLLPGRGWFKQNNSNPVGLNWFQGNHNVFPAQSGTPTSYIGANYGSTTGENTISNWLLTPNLTLYNGGVIKFWTRTTSNVTFPDRLELRLSTNGASTNVGTTPTSVGDFTRLLLTINPDLTEDGYPTVWTQYTISLSGLPPQGVSGRVAFRYFVTDGGTMGNNSFYIGVDTFSYLPIIGDPFPRAPLDYNGDGKTDFAVVRQTGGGLGGQVTWFIHNGTTHTQTAWGSTTDFFVAGDFDGDGKTDITVYRPQGGSSFFYTLRSSNGTFTARQLGTAIDDPTVVGDYDGDGIADYAVYRDGGQPGQKSFWYYLGSATPGGAIRYVEWGQNGDAPIPGDFDGDGKNDFCVQRPDGGGLGVFHLNKSGGGLETVYWGRASDSVLPGDYDGDGKDDFAVTRGSGSGHIAWNVLGRNNNNIIHSGLLWGVNGNDFPAPGDYDGDGKNDIAVWSPNANSQQTYFFVRQSSNAALRTFEWGQQGDYPVANYNSH